ncbi:MAG: carboxypeptidase regulatory-like domain-containing protein, partial [Acidobacteria bacterium]|nr:carboxypeptidase regulatory-like domain-containing protein [Acidobacteriota bacterium]
MWNRFILSILFLCIPMMLLAQIPSPTGRVAGVLKDPSGAVVPGGRIEIKNLDSRLTKATVTDQRGQYAFDSLPVGSYQVSVDASGFETSVRSD